MRLNKNSWLIKKPIAHRGLFNSILPENSLPAYQKAIDNGFAIEIDVFLTKDNFLVCVHDDNLLRLTGLNKSVWDLTLKEIKKLGFENLPICVAKTQYSLSDNQKLLGAPKDFELTVRNIEIRSGAGFLVVLLGNMLLMPGLSKNPAAVNMTIDESGKIEGLF